MRLTHWKGGGFTGPNYSQRLGPVEVGSLARPTAGAIHELLGACEFAGLPAALPAGAHLQTDPLEYRVLVEDGGRSNRVHWDDNAACPEGLRRLVELLRDIEGWTDCPWEEWHERAEAPMGRGSAS